MASLVARIALHVIKKHDVEHNFCCELYLSCRLMVMATLDQWIVTHPQPCGIQSAACSISLLLLFSLIWTQTPSTSCPTLTLPRWDTFACCVTICTMLTCCVLPNTFHLIAGPKCVFVMPDYPTASIFSIILLLTCTTKWAAAVQWAVTEIR